MGEEEAVILRRTNNGRPLAKRDEQTQTMTRNVYRAGRVWSPPPQGVAIIVGRVLLNITVTTTKISTVCVCVCFPHIGLLAHEQREGGGNTFRV